MRWIHAFWHRYWPWTRAWQLARDLCAAVGVIPREAWVFHRDWTHFRRLSAALPDGRTVVLTHEFFILWQVPFYTVDRMHLAVDGQPWQTGNVWTDRWFQGELRLRWQHLSFHQTPPAEAAATAL